MAFGTDEGDRTGVDGSGVSADDEGLRGHGDIKYVVDTRGLYRVVVELTYTYYTSRYTRLGNFHS